MKTDSLVLSFCYILKVVEFTGEGLKSSKRKTFITVELSRLVAETENWVVCEDESYDIQGEGVRLIVPPNNKTSLARLEGLLWIKLTDHTQYKLKTWETKKIKKVEYRMNKRIEMLLTNFQTKKKAFK